MTDRTRLSPLGEALVAFAAAAAATVAFAQLGRFVPLVADNLQVLVAAVFLYIPVFFAWRRDEDLAAYGFTFHPLRRSLIFGVLGPLVVFPLFLVGFVLFYQTVCARGAGFLAALAPPGLCPGFRGWAGLLHPRAPAALLEAVFTQVVVFAIPEELFFRGYLQKKLEEALPPRRRLLGGGLGLALVLGAALFALAHPIVDGNPRRLAVFFPGLLFGWLRSATGSITAGVIVHASSNLFIDTLQRTFFL